ncbi:IS1 family transposase [Candidatus Cyrtobacter comes]|uniref:IS1 family transposase n=1 Tax=Candidatus Cyrtobacter comes TaxID=675776 RepID=UPI002ACE3FC1|nr:IS1 family transposase [Candidatus Cyrtobacter comes]
MRIRIWLDRNRNEIIAHYIGNGSAGSAKELQVKHHNIRIIATDGNYSYNKIIPKRIKHIADKAGTCSIETKNPSLRGSINKKRYSKCYAQDGYVDV